MEIKKVEEKVLLSRDDVIRVHLYLKILQKGIHSPYNSDIEVLLELYKINGYDTKEKQDVFFQTCLDKEFKKSIQSIRNTLALYTELGILSKPRNLSRRVASLEFTEGILFLDCKISHANTN